MDKSPTNYDEFILNDQKLEFTETSQNEDFKRNVCIPYFKDIYKVLELSTFDILTLLIGSKQ